MAFTVIKLPDEPILLVKLDLATFSVEVSAQRLKEQVARYAAQAKTGLFMVLMPGQQNVMAGDIQLLIYDAMDAPNGSIADPRLSVAVVSDHPVISILQRKVRNQFGIAVEHFETLDDALAWARAQF